MRSARLKAREFREAVGDHAFARVNAKGLGLLSVKVRIHFPDWAQWGVADGWEVYVHTIGVCTHRHMAENNGSLCSQVESFVRQQCPTLAAYASSILVQFSHDGPLVSANVIFVH
jgi:hypothetical protein